MKLAYLEVTFRRARPLAACYHLPREAGDGSVRCERADAFVVDLAADGRPIGGELLAPADVELDALHDLLARLVQVHVREQAPAPLVGA